MSTTITCESYRNHIMSGFVRLQEQQEFVDLTLAADGHLVKVHKNIIALASPYIKDMLKTVSSQNPVIFLNNVSHNVLVYLLEYIYQGVVNVPEETIESFLEVSQSLHISGFDKLTQSKMPIRNAKISTTQPQPDKPSDLTCEQTERPSNIAACITINSLNNLEVQQFVENIQVLNVGSDYHTQENNVPQQVTNTNIIENNMPIINDYGNCVVNYDIRGMEVDLNLPQRQHTDTVSMKTTNPVQVIHESSSKTNSEPPLLHLTQPFELDKEASDALKTITQYSMSERGGLQIIISRFIYYCHHNSKGGRARRWRCADYRKLRCPAVVDTLDNRIVSRKGIHNHKFHDDRIYNKSKRKQIYHSLKDAVKAIELANTMIVNVDEDEESIEKDVCADDVREATELPTNEIFNSNEGDQQVTELSNLFNPHHGEDDDLEDAIEYQIIHKT